MFTGHRQVFESKIEEKIKNTLESLVEMGSRLVFLNGGMGQFDALCASAVRSLKKRHPEKEIQLCLSELPKKLTLNKLALIGEAEKSP